jgi:prepilin-type N-terminal cleavage/methylation domain-containing protein
MNKSFTLIEILVVIVVIGVLSAFILVGMSSITTSANIAKGKAFINSMDNSLLLARVSEWKLDNSSGTDSWSGKTATLVSSPTLTPNCAQDSCYTFNGTSQYAWIADDPVFNFGSYMSAFVWVKGVAQNNKHVFAQVETSKLVWRLLTSQVSPYNVLDVYITDNGTGGSGHSKQYEAATDVAFDNNWHLIGFTWNVGALKLYFDGRESAVIKYADNAITFLYDSDSNLTIGCSLSGGTPTSFFTGSIDDPRLYNQAIPTSEIQQNYFLGLNNLYKNKGLTQLEFNQRLVELKNNISENE